ncbi:MAG TPA: hypothetical protein VHE09_01990 [Rhizomicrobium sp.]|nr:hypothetical protein [Rhizomicrobium sp.]
MSELVNINCRNKVRWRLLSSASMLMFTLHSILPKTVHAEEAARPSVWIDLGGQLSRLDDGEVAFAPPIMANRPAEFVSSQQFEKPPGNSFDGTAKITLQPSESNWVFSASVRYGRANSTQHKLQQTSPLPTTKYLLGFYKRIVKPVAQRFADTTARSDESHAIVDFEAGKDVGLGLFGRTSGTSLISVGMRFAQFGSSSNFVQRSDPDWHFQKKYENFPPYYYNLEFINQPFHSNSASLTAERSFRGFGPSVSWKSSLPLAGNGQDGQLMADWGLNAAVLFGRQKTKTHHQSTARYGLVSVYKFTAVPHTTAQFPATPDHTRSRNVVVPNLGGFAGLSFKYPNAKISLGYRADFFFGAMDGGIDTRQTYDRGFYGPYASISIGLGG